MPLGSVRPAVSQRAKGIYARTPDTARGYLPNPTRLFVNGNVVLCRLVQRYAGIRVQPLAGLHIELLGDVWCLVVR